MNKKLYHLDENRILDWPRQDTEPIVGLDSRIVILDIIETPAPSASNNQVAVRVKDVINLNDLTLTWAWEIKDLSPPPDYKIWPNSQAFLSEFTMQEMAAIALSTDQTIAALRLLLSVWFSEVHSNDPRVTTGLDKLVELNIITEDRKNEILATAININ